MGESLDVLPEYRKPPVIEVVCGIQFAELTAFASVHFGEFWQRIKEMYPKTEDKPPLGDALEVGPESGVKAELMAFDMPPHRRVFYVDSSTNFLLQVQPSRFLANWRKVRDTDEYPRFATAYERFLKGWTLFLEFLKDMGLPRPEANQYELTYINHILALDESFPAGIQQFLPMFSWRGGQSIKFLPTPRSVAFGFQFPLPEPRGTLHVTVNHGFRKSDRQGLLVLDLTARGNARKDWSDMNEWFSVAHEWIVRGFTDLTSPAAHQGWERQR